VQEIITKKANRVILDDPRYATKKLLSDDYVLKLIDCGFYDIASKVSECGSFLVFSLEKNLFTSEQRRKLKRAHMCKNKFCSFCNWRRSLILSDEVKRALERLKEQRKVEILFLTLTAKNEPIENLRETIVYMNKAFQRLVQTRRFRESILGYVKAIEILGSKTPEGQSHVHFHCLLVVSSYYFKTKYYIKQDEWTKMWKKALRVGYEPVVNVKRIKAKRNWSEERSASRETIKYSLKHTDLVNRSNEDFKNIILQTKGMRFISTGGVLKDMINLERMERAKSKSKNDFEPFWYEVAREMYRWFNNSYELVYVPD